VGAGASGLLQIAAAHARAVDVVWVREPRPERLALAQGWGAEHHGNEPVDVAIVCTPDADAIAQAARWVAPGGTLCLYAPPAPGTAPGLDGDALFRRELSLTASYAAGPRDMRAALELLRAGRVDPLELVSHRVGLPDTERALELVRAGEALKAVVVP
jgi:L-iditol 2-dehydrogenase